MERLKKLWIKLDSLGLEDGNYLDAIESALTISNGMMQSVSEFFKNQL
jgi:hypothetical protein